MLIYHLLAIHQDLKDWVTNLSVIIFLIPLLSSSSAKISFSNTLLISKTFHFTAKISIALCQPIYLGTLKVFSLRLHVAGVKLCKLLEKIFSPKNFPATTRVWSNISYGNEWTSSQTFNSLFAFSWTKHFFFSTSWKYRGVPIWFKNLNPKRYAAKYRYRKGLDVYALAKRKWAKRKKQKPFPHKMNATVINFDVVTKFQFRYSIVRFLLVWLNQLNGLHPPLPALNGQYQNW